MTRLKQALNALSEFVMTELSEGRQIGYLDPTYKELVRECMECGASEKEIKEAEDVCVEKCLKGMISKIMFYRKTGMQCSYKQNANMK
jgi:hypothetical protein